MNLKDIEKMVLSMDIDRIESILDKIKVNDRRMFNQTINKLKIIFINSSDVLVLNKISLLFQSYRIFSAVPIILSKLLSGSYNENGGTLVYSLKGLRVNGYMEELMILYNRKTSYEMKEMLKMLGCNSSLN